MNITRVVLGAGNGKNVLARGRMTIDDGLMVHGIAVVRGRERSLVVAMPDKVVEVPCHQCRAPSRPSANFCHECGAKLVPMPTHLHEFKEVVHPISPDARAVVERAVLEEYRRSFPHA